MEIYTFKFVDEAIAKVDSTTVESQVALIRDMAETDAELTRQLLIEGADRVLTDAEHELKLSQERLTESRESACSLAQAFVETEDHSRLGALIYASGSIACLVSEANLGLAIPYVMNISPHSASAILMGVATASSALVLDVVAQKLGLTTNPWGLVRKITNSYLRWTASLLLVLFLLSVATVSVCSVLQLVPAREEAFKQQRHLDDPLDETMTPPDEGTIRRALEWYSLAVLVGAGLLTTCAVGEIRGLARRWSLRRKLDEKNVEVRGLQERCSRASAARDKANADVRNAPENGSRIAELTRSDRLLDLERARLRASKVDLAALVDSTLAIAR